MAQRCDVVVIGAGIVGLATARALMLDDPTSKVTVLDKEHGIARHQTGHNSGVVHSGIYYRPGSLKARLCIAGSKSVVQYASEHDIAVEVTGKLIAATRPEEMVGLQRLHDRGVEHGLDVKLLDAAGAREYEPNLAAMAAVHVASTGIIDFPAVAEAMADDIGDLGGEIRTGARVQRIDRGPTGLRRLSTTAGEFEAGTVVNCGGLHSDELARMAGAEPKARIVPFRGEYYSLRDEAAELVNGLIYPVPDPDFPFLGVHLTRGVDGSVHAGPNAVLAFSREGYRWRDLNPRDLLDTLRYPGFRALARDNLRQGLAEMQRSAVKALFLRELQRLVPDIGSSDLHRHPAGVRAQAVSEDGSLVDDFLIERSGDARSQVMHVLNAPSPAATASLEIGAEIARRLRS
ncbi:MAG: L-2-hydroxyglutarate oxidase [Actinomycetia bacterium]|nr:L-2-hydroxyglutarate oxidase [Actinomycetes bacterium]